MQIPVELPLVVRRIQDGFVAASAGVVQEDVGAAKGFLGCCQQPVAAQRGGDVAVDSDHLHRMRGEDFLARRRQPVGIARGDDDMGALRREALRHRQSDADAAAGDDGNLVAKSEIHACAPGLLRVAL